MNIETFDIRSFIDGYGSDNTNERNNRRIHTNEVFTPFEIIEHMCNMIDISDWSNPSKTFFEPTFGTGNIVCYIIYKRLLHGVNWIDTLNTLYGIELMPDNVKECKSRVISLLELFEFPDFNKQKALGIINRNLVCSDFFNWDIEKWEPVSQVKASTSNSLF